jgi:tetratricopeptide (TPR) repeat protein
MESGDYPQAIAVLRKFIEQEPELAGPYLNLGIAYRQTGQPDAALEALQKAIELNPANAVAHHQIAIVHREQGRFDAALEAYTRALELEPDYALAHRNLGILYDLYLQQPALALNHYRTYLELSQEPDSQVRDWVVDLQRRVENAQARAE